MFVGELNAGECFVALGFLWMVVVPNTQGVVYARDPGGKDREFAGNHRAQAATQTAFLKAEARVDKARATT
jgi:hypothetical protein